jgi:Icc-related predicted phosphoesterase
VEDLHLRRTEVGGLSWCGFAGSPRYSPHGGNEWTEQEAERELALLPASDVLLTHSPPEGVNDEPDDHAHRGSAALRAWVERHQPAWLLHGHTLPNPARRVHQVGPTRVVHVRGAMPLELG